MDEVVAWSPLLALYGRAYMDAALDTWWRWARTRAPAGQSIGKELTSLATRTHGCPARASPQLEDWLRCYDAGTDSLTPAAAAQWLQVYVTERDNHHRHRLPATVTGSTAARQQSRPTWRIGRSVLGPALKQPPPTYRAQVRTEEG